MTQLLIATHNRGKLREYATLLHNSDITLVTLDDVGITTNVEETGTTYAENARIKAEAYMRQSQCVTLADDSGLEVAALGGAPGVYSARYGGVTGRAQLDYLLQQLHGVPFHQRVARFVCVIALAHPNGTLEFAEGTVSGVIEEAPRGTGGFGYDPLFYVLDDDKTMAELPPERKHAISHRAMALRDARAILTRWRTMGLLSTSNSTGNNVTQ
jgi:XTP/dITP diphosphohydrolase